jgi:hypothetical protein
MRRAVSGAAQAVHFTPDSILMDCYNVLAGRLFRCLKFVFTHILSSSFCPIHLFSEFQSSIFAVFKLLLRLAQACLSFS